MVSASCLLVLLSTLSTQFLQLFLAWCSVTFCPSSPFFWFHFHCTAYPFPFLGKGFLFFGVSLLFFPVFFVVLFPPFFLYASPRMNSLHAGPGYFVCSCCFCFSLGSLIVFLFFPFPIFTNSGAFLLVSFYFSTHDRTCLVFSSSFHLLLSFLGLLLFGYRFSRVTLLGHFVSFHILRLVKDCFILLVADDLGFVDRVWSCP